MTQYSKRMVIMHWVTLALLLAAWYLGDNLADSTDQGKATLSGYVVHMLVGGAVFFATILRLYFRRHDGIPPPAGDTAMDRVAKAIQNLIYVLLFALPVSGIVIIFTSKVGAALVASNASMLPHAHGFRGVVAHEVHEQLVNVLIALVGLHVLGAFKHQFIAKDGLMGRMMLRRKS